MIPSIDALIYCCTCGNCRCFPCLLCRFRIKRRNTISGLDWARFAPCAPDCDPELCHGQASEVGGYWGQMLYLTLKDEPFHSQVYDEHVLLERVRSIARRDAGDRTESELMKFQESLERIGLLWKALDSLDESQCFEFVRNLHLELAVPGGMVYLKHSPAMRSYVVLRGTILLCTNVLDRAGAEGSRALSPGCEFGAPLDTDLDMNLPVAGFEEYAKCAPLEVDHESDGDPAATSRADREDGRAELLVISRHDWSSAMASSREKIDGVVSKDTASKAPDPLKAGARVAFNFPAKGRREEHLRIAMEYLTERVPFCADLPEAEVKGMAAAIELFGLTDPGRTIFRRGRECYGEVYIMFTGTADETDVDCSGDRLVKEGDLLGDENFGAGVKGVHDAPLRTSTAVSRTAPCELLVIPPRECRRLLAHVTRRNSEKAVIIFERFFHNMPRETLLELASLATFRKIKVHEKLASEGENVSTLFFVFRGECSARRADEPEDNRRERYGPGHIVGWPYLVPDGSASIAYGRDAGKPHVNRAGAERQVLKPQVGTERRSRRKSKEWHHTIIVTTPAQVLSVPLDELLNGLSDKAKLGLRSYISLTHASKSEEDVLGRTASSSNLDPPEGMTTKLLDGEEALRSRNRSPLQPESNSRTRWRWRVGIAESKGASLWTPSSPVPARSFGKGCAQRFTEAHQGRECVCPQEKCDVCSPMRRLTRFHSAPAWAPTRTPNSDRIVTSGRNLCATASNGAGFTRRSPNSVAVSVPHNRLKPAPGKVDKRAPVSGTSLQGEDARVPLDEPVIGESFYVPNGHMMGAAVPNDFNVSLTSDECNGLAAANGMARAKETAADESRSEQEVYALVQLSTRAALDPMDSAAALCFRMLGCFEFEVDAKLRIQNLYHTIFPQQPTWLPCQGSSRRRRVEVVDCTDHVFLLRKGVPVKRLSFDVKANSVPSPRQPLHPIGRGYDKNFPAVFKAKMQNFAIVLMPSSDRLVSEWEQQQKRHGDLLKGVGETPPQGLDEVAKFASIWQSTRASSDNGSDLSTMLNVETQVDERQSDVAYAETEESITANATVEDENLSDRVEVLEGEDVKTSLVLTHQTTGGGHVDDEAERDVSAHPPRGDDENGAKPGMVSTGGNTHYAAKRSDTPERSVSGSSLDILLDHDSDTETSSHDIETGRVLEHERGTAVGDTADREGTFVASSKEHVGREDAISWIIRRTGFIDKVEGCFETEAAAFRKAVNILGAIATAVSGTHIPLVPLSTMASPIRACIFPLYEWLSHGDGSVRGVDEAIVRQCVTEPSTARRADVDQSTVWNNHRARTLRTNLYNLFEAAGPREIRSRCGWDAPAGFGDGCNRIRAGGGGSVKDRRAWRDRPERAAKKAARTARDAVLRQNQKLIHAEIHARRRREERTTAAMTAPLAPTPVAYAETDPRHDERGERTDRVEQMAETREYRSRRTGLSIVATEVSPSTAGGGRSASRKELEVEMKIERKRARLFEDIRMLPYIVKPIGSTGSDVGRQTDSRRVGEREQRRVDIRAVVRRAPGIQAQTSLYGRPAASFFKRAHAAGALAVEKAATDECDSSGATVDGCWTAAKTSVGTESQVASPPYTTSSEHIGSNTSMGTKSSAGMFDVKTVGRLSSGEQVVHTRKGDSSSIGGVVTAGSRAKSAAHKKLGNIGLWGTRHRVARWGDRGISSAPAGVTSLDGQLVLLDGFLHDSKVKAWVETTLRSPAQCQSEAVTLG